MKSRRSRRDRRAEKRRQRAAAKNTPQVRSNAESFVEYAKAARALTELEKKRNE